MWYSSLDEDDDDEEYKQDNHQWIQQIERILKPLSTICPHNVLHQAKASTRDHEHSDTSGFDNLDQVFHSLDTLGHVPINNLTRNLERHFAKFAHQLTKELLVNNISKNPRLKEIKYRLRKFELMPIGSFPADTKVGDINEFDYLCVLKLPLKRKNVAPLDLKNTDSDDDEDASNKSASSDSSYSSSDSDSDDGAVKSSTYLMLPKDDDESDSDEGTRGLELGDMVKLSKKLLKPFLSEANQSIKNNPFVSNIYSHGPATCIEISWVCQNEHTHTVGVDISIGSRSKNKLLSNHLRKWLKGKMKILSKVIPTISANLPRYTDECIFIYPMYSSEKLWLISSCSFDSFLFDRLEEFWGFNFKKLLRCLKLMTKYLLPIKYTFSKRILSHSYSGAFVSSHTLKCLITDHIKEHPYQWYWKSEYFSQRVINILQSMLVTRRIFDQSVVHLVWPVCKDIVTDSFVSFIKQSSNDPFSHPSVLDDINDLIQRLQTSLEYIRTIGLSKKEIALESGYYIRYRNKVHVITHEQIALCKVKKRCVVVYPVITSDGLPHEDHPLIRSCKKHLLNMYLTNKGFNFAHSSPDIFKIFWGQVVRRKTTISRALKRLSLSKLCQGTNIRFFCRIDNPLHIPNQMIKFHKLSPNQRIGIHLTKETIETWFRFLTGYVNETVQKDYFRGPNDCSSLISLGFLNYLPLTNLEVSGCVDQLANFFSVLMNHIWTENDIHFSLPPEDPDQVTSDETSGDSEDSDDSESLTGKYHQFLGPLNVEHVGNLALDLEIEKDVEHLEFLCVGKIPLNVLLASGVWREKMIEYRSDFVESACQLPVKLFSRYSTGTFHQLDLSHVCASIRRSIEGVDYPIDLSIRSVYTTGNAICLDIHRRFNKTKLSKPLLIRLYIGAHVADPNTFVLSMCSLFPSIVHEIFQSRMFTFTYSTEGWIISSLQAEKAIYDILELKLSPYIRPFVRALHYVLKNVLPDNIYINISQGVCSSHLHRCEVCPNSRALTSLLLAEIIQYPEVGSWDDKSLIHRFIDILDLRGLGKGKNYSWFFHDGFDYDESNFALSLDMLSNFDSKSPLCILIDKLKKWAANDKFKCPIDNEFFKSDLLYHIKDDIIFIYSDKVHSLVMKTRDLTHLVRDKYGDHEFVYRNICMHADGHSNPITCIAQSSLCEFMKESIFYDLSSLQWEYQLMFFLFITFTGKRTFSKTFDMPHFLDVVTNCIALKNRTSNVDSLDIFNDGSVRSRFREPMHVESKEVVTTKCADVSKIIKSWINGLFCICPINSLYKMLNKTYTQNSHNSVPPSDSVLINIGNAIEVPSKASDYVKLERLFRCVLKSILAKAFDKEWLATEAQSFIRFTVQNCGDFPCGILTSNVLEYICFLEFKDENLKSILDKMIIMKTRLIAYLNSGSYERDSFPTTVVFKENIDDKISLYFEWICFLQHAHGMTVHLILVSHCPEAATTRLTYPQSLFYQTIPICNELKSKIVRHSPAWEIGGIETIDHQIIIEYFTQRYTHSFKAVFRGIKYLLEIMLPFVNEIGSMVLEPIISTHSLLLLFCLEANYNQELSDCGNESLNKRIHGVLQNLIEYFYYVQNKDSKVLTSLKSRVFDCIGYDNDVYNSLTVKDIHVIVNNLQDLCIILSNLKTDMPPEEAPQYNDSIVNLKEVYILHEGFVYRCLSGLHRWSCGMVLESSISDKNPMFVFLPNIHFANTSACIEHCRHHIKCQKFDIDFSSIQELSDNLNISLAKTDSSDELTHVKDDSLDTVASKDDSKCSVRKQMPPNPMNETNFIGLLPKLCTFELLHKARSEKYGKDYLVLPKCPLPVDIIISLSKMCHVPRDSTYMTQFALYVKHFVQYISESALAKYPLKFAEEHDNIQTVDIKSFCSFEADTKVGDIDELSFHCQFKFSDESIKLSKITSESSEMSLLQFFAELEKGIASVFQLHVGSDPKSSTWDFRQAIKEEIHSYFKRVRKVSASVHFNDTTSIINITWNCPKKHLHTIRLNIMPTFDFKLHEVDREFLMENIAEIFKPVLIRRGFYLRFAYSPSSSCWHINFDHILSEIYQQLRKEYPVYLFHAISATTVLLERLYPTKVSFLYGSHVYSRHMKWQTISRVILQHTSKTSGKDWDENMIFTQVLSMLELFSDPPVDHEQKGKYIWPSVGDEKAMPVVAVIDSYDMSVLFTKPFSICDDVKLLIEFIQEMGGSEGDTKNFRRTSPQGPETIAIRQHSQMLLCSNINNHLHDTCNEDCPQVYLYRYAIDKHMAFVHHPLIAWCRSNIQRLYQVIGGFDLDILYK